MIHIISHDQYIINHNQYMYHVQYIYNHVVRGLLNGTDIIERIETLKFVVKSVVKLQQKSLDI
jgi:hypothetical protein